MEIFILITLGMICLFTLLKSRKIANPIFLMSGLWFIVLLFAFLQLYDMKSYATVTVWIIFVGVLGFCLGGMFAFLLSKRKGNTLFGRGLNNKNSKSCFVILKVNWTVAYIFLFFSFLTIFCLFVVSILQVMSGASFYTIHSMYYGYDNTELLIENEVLNDIITWVSIPSLYASLFITMSCFFFGELRKGYGVISVITLFMYIFATASRIMLATVVIMGILFYQHYKNNLSKKRKRQMRLLFCVSVIVLLLFIFTRSNNSSIPTLYVYLSIPVPILDYWTQQFNLSGNYFWGGATFYGVTSWLNYISQSLFNVDIPAVLEAREWILGTQNVWLTIFPGKVLNAFCSCFFYFYMDCGIFGVIVFDLLFGFVSYKLYYSVFVLNQTNKLPYYCLALQCIIFSFVRWQAGTQGFIVELIIILLVLPHRIKFRVHSKSFVCKENV